MTAPVTESRFTDPEGRGEFLRGRARPATHTLVAFIAEHRDRFGGVEPICRILTEHDCSIHPSTYYAHVKGQPSARAVRNAELTEVLKQIHRENYGVYGVRKMWAALKRAGDPDVARCTVERLMKAAGLSEGGTRQEGHHHGPGRGPARSAGPGPGALTPGFGHRRDLDLDGPGERSPRGMKHYPIEFKADAVALYRSRPGATIKSVAADLGVNTETLRNWIRAADGRRPGAHSVPPAAKQADGDDVQAELAAARKRIRELEEERDILRKAARYFATETRW
ncbi:IS3 family transposase [Streptomyces sp. NBC_01264]|uniref:IS3 family transposase n=1 Tax=Streptomyces sp. NBC_01264 TaxID=2903804 RepID=UPI002256AE34|nr:IS3 family transposase [Streptomyces sp. NBC_01264]MCX4775309.1 IS3 family transposase [Streptomyces sp. NBC_01264]